MSLVLPPILAARFAFEKAYFVFASWDATMFAARQTLASGDPAKALDLAKRVLARTRSEARGGARQNREALIDRAALLASCYWANGDFDAAIETKRFEVSIWLHRAVQDGGATGARLEDSIADLADMLTAIGQRDLAEQLQQHPLRILKV